MKKNTLLILLWLVVVMAMSFSAYAGSAASTTILGNGVVAGNFNFTVDAINPSRFTNAVFAYRFVTPQSGWTVFANVTNQTANQGNFSIANNTATLISNDRFIDINITFYNATALGAGATEGLLVSYIAVNNTALNPIVVSPTSATNTSTIQYILIRMNEEVTSNNVSFLFNNQLLALTANATNNEYTAVTSELPEASYSWTLNAKETASPYTTLTRTGTITIDDGVNNGGSVGGGGGGGSVDLSQDILVPPLQGSTDTPVGAIPNAVLILGGLASLFFGLKGAFKV